MTDKSIDLDHHCGMAPQKATNLLSADLDANRMPCAGKGVEISLAGGASGKFDLKLLKKVHYLLNLFGATLNLEDPGRQKLMAAVQADFDHLSGRKLAIRAFKIRDLPL
jgi:hypothetical protein